MIDITAPDPSPRELRSALGEVLQRIGEVTIKRKSLPGRGFLYATTKGLYFLPHHVEQVTELTEDDDTGTTIMWSIAASFWLPLYLLLPFVKSQRTKTLEVTVYRPQILTDELRYDLSELLMDNPGALFLSSHSVRAMRRKRGSWLLDRVSGSRLKVRPITHRRLFDRRMHELCESPIWRHTVM